ncbi:hypothetical protein [Spiroplasma turonicum]|uniref:Uncharacterized protein n=1 Tax=Spiroplasma turonicum TaxID=216946 RepID=A0A0K1P6C4_9MOLU|nr:hypothetical protein [Spiroplasma turonicum]AKU79861.1 hypothetical protein STURON_00615 [Spiroplasma turonicum]ALX70876.1 hypothetical protein STURO_v1c06130 [Spiroplasma turonicum]
MIFKTYKEISKCTQNCLSNNCCYVQQESTTLHSASNSLDQGIDFDYIVKTYFSNRRICSKHKLTPKSVDSILFNNKISSKSLLFLIEFKHINLKNLKIENLVIKIRDSVCYLAVLINLLLTNEIIFYFVYKSRISRPANDSFKANHICNILEEKLNKFFTIENIEFKAKAMSFESFDKKTNTLFILDKFNENINFYDFCLFNS